MVRVREKRVSDLKNWVKGGPVQEHRQRETWGASRKEQESGLERAELPHPDTSRGDGRCPAQRGLDQGEHWVLIN